VHELEERAHLVYGGRKSSRHGLLRAHKLEEERF
jgi:hypothetical protein